jgi:cytochrome c
MLCLALGLGMTGSAVGAAANGDAAAGQALYQAKCGGCHSLDVNRIGPAHRGVVGRRIASAPGYDYSPALKKLAGVWTPSRSDQWLQGPQKLAPGSKMFFSLADSTQRRDIISYLGSVSASRR